jgi:Secretion system C-terminal sorting domain
MNIYVYKRAVVLTVFLLSILGQNTVNAQRKGGGSFPMQPSTPYPREPVALDFCQQFPEKCINTPCETNRQPSTSNVTAPVNKERLTRKNTFNWTTSSGINWQGANGSQSLYTPFFQTDNNITGHFAWPNPDYKPEDGWELLKKDFGGILGNNNDPNYRSINPYLVLYNKYNGRLRVFMARGMNAQANNMNFILTQIGNKSSLLDLAIATIKAIDAPFTPVSLKAVSPVYDTEGKWFYADFQTVYDPCTCVYGGNKFSINVKRIQNSSIEMSGTLEGDIVSKENKQMTPKGGNQYSFSDLRKDGDKFVKVVGSMGEFMSDLNKHTQTDTAGLKVSAVVKNAIGAANTAATSATDWFKKLKGGLSAVPYLNSVLSIFDMFSAGGGNAGPQKVEIQPMSINAALKLKGNITTETDYTGITMATPGAIMDGVPDSDVPHYNEVMGVFNLLKTPKIGAGVIGTQNWNPWWDWEGLYGETKDILEYRLVEPLVYVLNPAAGLEIQDIQVAFEAEFWQYYGPAGYNQIGVLKNGNQLATTQPFSNPCALVAQSMLEPYGSTIGEPHRLRITVNLKRKDGLGDNVLLSYVYSAQTGFTFDPSTRDCQANFFRPATSDEINGVNGLCKSATYKANRIQAIKQNPWEKPDFTTLKGNLKLNMEIYPNPATDNITVSYDLEEDTKIKVYLTDLTGRTVSSVFDDTVKKGVYSLDFPLQNLSNGMYLLIFETEKERLTKKVVISK